MKKLTIKTWALDDRPREKLLYKGKSALSNAELLAILLRTGTKEMNAVDLAKNILRGTDDNINELAKLSVEKLMTYKGIGEAKAVAIVTALELGKRRQKESSFQLPKISSSKQAYELLFSELSDLLHEEFWVAYLNNSNRVLSKEMISKGGITSSIVDTRLIYKKAIELSAVAIIAFHNHPSGELKPSSSDISLTKKLQIAGDSLDIRLLDHIIIAEKSYFSFADHNMI